LAHSIAESRVRLANRSYRLVLIDMKLTDGHGGEVYRLVHELSPNARTVLITGLRGDSAQVVQQVLNEGADAVCYKPFDVEQLLATVKELIAIR
jgi:DNA-binding response OmpR family regulator